MKQEGTPRTPRALCATENNENLAERKTHHRCAVTLDIEEFIFIFYLPKNKLQ